MRTAPLWLKGSEVITYRYESQEIAEVLLTDSILDKTTTGTSSLNVLVKQAELRSEGAQLDVEITVAENSLRKNRDRSID
jgi:hypothetical protein